MLVPITLQLKTYARPQTPRFFWSAPRIAAAAQPITIRTFAIHGLPLKSDWFTIENKHSSSAHLKKISSDQRTLVLMLTKKERSLSEHGC